MKTDTDEKNDGWKMTYIEEKRLNALVVVE
jgi:hypothetical protein